MLSLASDVTLCGLISMGEKDMTQKIYSIGELAELSGTTVRTIQYYDQIGLLVAQRSESDLRFYTPSDLMKLQQILFYKRLDFPLKEIKKNLENVEDKNDLESILKKQEKILFQKEMEIKMKRVIIEAVKYSIERDEEIDLDPFIKIILKLEQETIMRYTTIDFDMTIDEKDIEIDGFIELYWDWKQLVLEAASLKLSQTNIESQAGYQIGERWHEFLEGSDEENSQIMQVAQQGVEQRDEWPEEDLFLYNFTQQFIEDAYQYYLKKREDLDD